MRFAIIHKTNAAWEAGALPDDGLIARVGSLLGALANEGVLLSGEGLGPSSKGARVRFANADRTILPGPFTGGNELPAGFSIVRTPSLEEAVDWATRQASILGDTEVDIRPVNEPWDIGIAARPADLTTRRYMVLRKATEATEAGITPTPAARAQLSRLIEETTRTGVHVATEMMRPSRKGRRFTNSADGVSFFDGPFTETKELLGGYVIVQAESLENASRWAARYIGTVDAAEVDVRELE